LVPLPKEEVSTLKFTVKAISLQLKEADFEYFSAKAFKGDPTLYNPEDLLL
jgi:hypothetical protein